jgi:hypothetical protein
MRCREDCTHLWEAMHAAILVQPTVDLFPHWCKGCFGEGCNGTGSARRWRPRTPAMAAGLTDHVWTLREVLLFRVPLWPQPEEV